MLDLPGHGRSEGLGEQSIAGYATAVKTWLGVLQIPQAVFAGHSMGGAICQYLGLYHPEIVAGLALIGTGARLRVLPEILENSGSTITYSMAVDQIIRYSFGPSIDQRIIELSKERLSEVRPTVLHGDYLACDNFDLMEEIHNIQAPTIVITGTEDLMTPPRYAQYLANKIPGASLVLVPEAGHMIGLEKPNDVAMTLLNFLAKLS